MCGTCSYIYWPTAYPEFFWDTSRFSQVPGVGYGDFENTTTHIVANQYAYQVRFFFDTFNIEPGWDKLYYGELISRQPYWTGTIAPGWSGFTVSQSLQKTPGILRFSSDVNTAGDGITLDGAEVCCRPTAYPDQVYMRPLERYIGFLADTNDAVYFRWPASSDAHETLSVIGTAADGSTVDIDVWIACNAIPNAYNTLYSATTSLAEEFVHIDPSISNCPSGNWYAAIWSYRGKGVFDAIRSQHKSTEHRVIRAGTSSVLGATQLGYVQEALGNGLREFFGASAGNEYFTAALYNKGRTSAGACDCGGYACNVCYLNYATDAALCYPGQPAPGYVEIPLNDWCPDCGFLESGPFTSGLTLAHEWGHCVFSLPDEYNPTGPLNWGSCGHSLMRRSGDNRHNNKFCVAADHTANSWPAPPGCSSCVWDDPTPMWDLISSTGRVKLVPAETPDNTDFRSHSFPGAFGARLGNVTVMP